MIHQAKSNPQLLDEQIFSERLRARFLLLGTKPTCRCSRRMSVAGCEADMATPVRYFAF